jgi:hypothetical protein
MQRRFELLREEDVIGVSGTGVVAEGVEFSHGMVAISFISGPCHGVEVWTSIKEAKMIHGHGGKTKFEYKDPDPEDKPAKKE